MVILQNFGEDEPDDLYSALDVNMKSAGTNMQMKPKVDSDRLEPFSFSSENA